MRNHWKQAGKPVLRPADSVDVGTVRIAVITLRNVRNMLARAGCPQASDAVRRALKSTEGAYRHVQRRRSADPMRKAMVRTSGGRVLSLEAWLQDWEVRENWMLADSIARQLKKRGWACGGDLERIELVEGGEQ